MANFAFIENNQIVGVYDNLPKNWRNISNFNVLTVDEIYPLGWRTVQKDIPEFDPKDFKIDNPRHELIDDNVYERYDLIELPKPQITEPVVLTEQEILELEKRRIDEQWSNIRNYRDRLMAEFEWRYTRYNRQIRLGISPTDSIENMDLYMQQLADITNQTDPFSITWPNFIESTD